MHKLYPFSNITRPVRESCNSAPRVRVERNVTIEAESFSGANIHFQIFSFDFTPRFLISSIIMNTLASLCINGAVVRAPVRSLRCRKIRGNYFSPCAVRRVNQERPKVIFRHDDRISCISPPPLLFFPSSRYSFHAEKFSPLSLLFSGHSLSLNSSTDTENHIEAAGS